MPEKLYTIEEAADYLRYSAKTMYNLVQRGAITYRKIGPRHTAIRFTAEDLQEYLERGTVVKSNASLNEEAEKNLKQGE